MANQPAIIQNTKDKLLLALYRLRYGGKCRNLNIDSELLNYIVDRRTVADGSEVLKMIKESKNQEDFRQRTVKHLQKTPISYYTNSLLMGNIIGKYMIHESSLRHVENLNLDSFTKENQDLLPILREHFYEYVMENNKDKNAFATRTIFPMQPDRPQKDLTKDIDKERVEKVFDQIIHGERINPQNSAELEDGNSQIPVVYSYIINTIGTYSRDDIQNHFDFVLYDLRANHSEDLEKRRERYFQHCSLSPSQLKKLEKVSVLKERLYHMKTPESKELLSRLSSLGSDLDGQIDEIEDIYNEYEVLLREDMVNRLYVPTEDITVITDYKEVKPQLIHQFIRHTEKYETNEFEKIKQKIIADRTNGDTTPELTQEEQKRFEKMKEKAKLQLDQYQVNHSFTMEDGVYSDANGWYYYHSDTSNQISASILDLKDLQQSFLRGIIGIGFNKENLSPEAIAISSASYKTTNRGLNNMEYDEQKEFEEMSAPFSELLNANGKSEVVMHRRGIDFDTKASYFLAIIDSSNPEEAKKIMQQVEEVRKKEGLKAVVLDMYQINQSMAQDKQKESLDR